MRFGTGSRKPQADATHMIETACKLI